MSVQDPSPELRKRQEKMAAGSTWLEKPADNEATRRQILAARVISKMRAEEAGTQMPSADPALLLDPQIAKSAERSRRAVKRIKTGFSFQGELDDTHDGLSRDGFAHILPHHPATIRVKNEIKLKKGSSPCDYSGHVNLHWKNANEFRMIDGKDPGAMLSVRQVPVVFDAKVLSAGHASYTHDRKLIAQLLHLKAASDAGACAFLLVRADEVARAYVLGWKNHEHDLMRFRPIKLWESKRGTVREGYAGHRAMTGEQFDLLPSIAYTPGKGWLWPQLLPWLL